LFEAISADKKCFFFFFLFVKAWTPIGLSYKMFHCLKSFINRLD